MSHLLFRSKLFAVLLAAYVILTFARRKRRSSNVITALLTWLRLRRKLVATKIDR